MKNFLPRALPILTTVCLILASPVSSFAIPGKGTPGKGTPGKGTPGKGTPRKGTPGEGTSSNLGIATPSPAPDSNENKTRGAYIPKAGIVNGSGLTTPRQSGERSIFNSSRRKNKSDRAITAAAESVGAPQAQDRVNEITEIVTPDNTDNEVPYTYGVSPVDRSTSTHVIDNPEENIDKGTENNRGTAIKAVLESVGGTGIKSRKKQLVDNPTDEISESEVQAIKKLRNDTAALISVLKLQNQHLQQDNITKLVIVGEYLNEKYSEYSSFKKQAEGYTQDLGQALSVKIDQSGTLERENNGQETVENNNTWNFDYGLFFNISRALIPDKDGPKPELTQERAIDILDKLTSFIKNSENGAESKDDDQSSIVASSTARLRLQGEEMNANQGSGSSAPVIEEVIPQDQPGQPGSTTSADMIASLLQQQPTREAIDTLHSMHNNPFFKATSTVSLVALVAAVAYEIYLHSLQTKSAS